MKTGDRKTETLHFGDCDGRTFTGTVVWIHPQRRFYVVEFRFGGRTFREAFYFPGRGGNT